MRADGTEQDDLSFDIRAMLEDARVSAAMSRVVVQTLASLSQTCAVTAMAALEEETCDAVRRNASHSTVQAFESLAARLARAPTEVREAAALEAALILAAERAA